MCRKYPNLPVISAAGIILIDDKVLIIKRKSEPNRGKWSIPGGVINLGERIEEGLKREVFEETGINVEVKNLIEIVEKVFNDDNGNIIYHYVILDYLCQYISGEAKVSSDAEDLMMVYLDELGKFNMVDGMKEIIEKAYTFDNE